MCVDWCVCERERDRGDMEQTNKQKKQSIEELIRVIDCLSLSDSVDTQSICSQYFVRPGSM